ncbi:hypothetical protein TPHA_0L00330 [Tetrapisispora phaffii CBS 4417]|uniref:Cystathionine gamma-synthase n=1 Tax=Tetrapisispora phaffii (strain ATCC 24235 / CBS 4417 / NBRC 1672 / NRRL Y-8282 / UCD 70-5) TaxID=1071381 RepID=G8BZR1_TETPH|nr:hypothetical protein TPHA_0L00330 [Tetrapisispora phaffii CBS 4417]CCE65389.1 hypothetical protein TPHA_0L00330 [Tetrapisispora phaffii CBS 4417]
MAIANKVGESVSGDGHTISICLPTWATNVGYKENDPVVLNAMSCGYPRLFIHRSIQRLCDILTNKYAKENESCLCFPSYKVAKRCREFIRVVSSRRQLPIPKVRILQLATSRPVTLEEARWKKECRIAVVFVDKAYYTMVRNYWQYTGEIISSRLAEYVLHELFIVEKSSRGSHLSRPSTMAASYENEEEFVESRYGRKLNFSLGDKAQQYIKKRIATKSVDVLDDMDDGGSYHFVANAGRFGTAIEALNTDAEATENEETPPADNSVPLLEQINNDRVDTDNLVDLQSGTELISAIPAEPIVLEASDTESNTANGLVFIANDLGNDNRSSLKIDYEKDVYLFPSGMAALFTAHRLLLNLDARRVNRSKSNSNVNALGNNSSNGSTTSLDSHLQNSNDIVGYGYPYKKSVVFGFSNSDTVSLLNEFNHTHYFGKGDAESMKELEQTLHSGEQILAVFIEIPSNPLLKVADLKYLRNLANIYGFYIVIDETLGGFVNIDVLPFADIVCSSLSQSFGGDSNVMAGSMVLNPQEKLYQFAQLFLNQLGEYENYVWCEDAIILERNSRDFIPRSITINHNSEYLINEVLLPNEGPDKIFKKIYYPSLTSDETKENYDKLRCKKIPNFEKEEGGYGGIISLTFHNLDTSKRFFDEINITKGPSLSTNHTLACPYTILSYFDNLAQVEKFGVEENLIRIKIGCESKEDLAKVFLHAIEKAQSL